MEHTKMSTPIETARSRKRRNPLMPKLSRKTLLDQKRLATANQVKRRPIQQ